MISQEKTKPSSIVEDHLSLKLPVEVIVDPSARPMLNGKVQETLDRLLVVLKNEASGHHMPLTRIEVRGFVDPEENVQEVVVRQWMSVSPDEALDYWNRLGSLIEVWADALPEKLKSVAVESLAIEVWGNVDESTS